MTGLRRVIHSAKAKCDTCGKTFSSQYPGWEHALEALHTVTLTETFSYEHDGSRMNFSKITEGDA
jgi:hypothetical protein